jgi:hypothetical protein
MQYFISALTTTILLSVAIFPAVAQAQDTAPTASPNAALVSPPATTLRPFNLVYLAYQGYLKDQGIPSNGELINAIDSGTITAQDLIQAAVKANRLSEPMLGDRGYRHHLQVQLQALTAE